MNYVIQSISRALSGIYFHLAPVNGGWSEWGFYGKCSKTCGIGTTIRRRVCNNPPPRDGGLPCSGSEVQDARCHLKACRKL